MKKLDMMSKKKVGGQNVYKFYLEFLCALTYEDTNDFFLNKNSSDGESNTENKDSNISE